MTVDDPDLAALAGVTSHLRLALSSMGDQQRGLPTPCSEWDLATLVDHVTGGNWFTIRALAGDTADEAMASTVSRFGDGSATRDEAIQSATDQLVAFNETGVLDRSWYHVAGTLPGRRILRLRLHDLIVHTWDIGETLHPPASLPAELVGWGLEDLGDGDSLMAEHFGVTQTPAPSAPGDAMAAYLGAFGRLPAAG